MDKVVIDRVIYKVTENLGFIHSLGCYAQAVETPHGPRIAACPAGGEWSILWCFAPADDGPRLRMG